MGGCPRRPCFAIDRFRRLNIVVKGRGFRCTNGYERISSGNDCHSSVEPVTAARNCLDQVRAIVPEFSSQFTNALHERIVGDGQIGPNRCKNLIFGNKTTGILDEAIEHGECFRSKRNFDTVSQKAAATQIQNIAIEQQSIWWHLRRRVGIASSHHSTMQAKWICKPD